jgi:regulatory protein
MGVITALEMQKRNKERVNVFLDGEYAFSLVLIEAAKLRKGQTLTDEEIAALRDDDDINRAVDRAVRFLSYRPRSTQEVRNNLAKKDFSEITVETAIERLMDMSYLDDAAFARFWMENRTKFKPRGPMALRYELRQKGIENSIIDSVLDELDVDEAAYYAAVSKAKRLHNLNQQEFRHKLGGFLQRRGFSYGTVRDVIKKVESEMVTDDPDFFVDDEG